MTVKRLVCVVEGTGDVSAVPALCTMVRNHLEAWDWVVDPDAIRQPRSRLVDERVASPRRPVNDDGLGRAIALAKGRPADGVIVLCDSDDDCAAVWGTSAQQVLDKLTNGACVMAVREYEAWLLTSSLGSSRLNERPIDDIRDAKGAFATQWHGYKPSVHQLKATRTIDVARLRELSPSFDKLVRSLAAIFTAKRATGSSARRRGKQQRHRK